MNSVRPQQTSKEYSINSKFFDLQQEQAAYRNTQWLLLITSLSVSADFVSELIMNTVGSEWCVLLCVCVIKWGRKKASVHIGMCVFACGGGACSSGVTHYWLHFTRLPTCSGPVGFYSLVRISLWARQCLRRSCFYYHSGSAERLRLRKTVVKMMWITK